MTPIQIAGVLLELLTLFKKNGKTPDQPATDAEMNAAAAKAQASLDGLQAAIDAARRNPPGS